jgi:DHA1 family multidrug resistance protein-like MFS transporter
MLKALTKAPRWQRTLIVLFFSQMATAIGFSSIFPFLPLYVKSLGSSTGMSVELLSGLVFSAQAFTMMLASPVWGLLADRYGRKLMVVRASFGGSAILLLMAFAQSAEQLVGLRALQGLISGTVAANSALLASQVPRERMGYAMGMLQVGLGAGVAFGPLIGGIVADTFGYASAFYVTAAMLFVAGVVVFIGVREDFHPQISGERRGLGIFVFWGQLLQFPGVSPTYSVRFLTQLARSMLAPIMPLFVVVLMADAARVNSFTGLLIGAQAAATTVSAMFLGRLADRIGHRKVAAVSAILAGLFYLPQSLVTEEWQLLVLATLVGVALGGVIPTLSAILARYTESGAEGAVFGLDTSIRSGARALAPLLGSWIALTWGLRGTFVVTGFILLLTGLATHIFLPEPAQPRKPSIPRPHPSTM